MKTKTNPHGLRQGTPTHLHLCPWSLWRGAEAHASTGVPRSPRRHHKSSSPCSRFPISFPTESSSSTNQRTVIFSRLKKKWNSLLTPFSPQLSFFSFQQNSEFLFFVSNPSSSPLPTQSHQALLPLLLFEAGTDPGKQSKCPTEATVLSVKCWDTHRNLEIYQWDIQFNGIHWNQMS